MTGRHVWDCAPQNQNIRAAFSQEASSLDVGCSLTLKTPRYLLIIFLRTDARWKSWEPELVALPVLTFNPMFNERNAGLFPNGWDGKGFHLGGLLTMTTSEECSMKRKGRKVSSQSHAWPDQRVPKPAQPSLSSDLATIPKAPVHLGFPWLGRQQILLTETQEPASSLTTPI